MHNDDLLASSGKKQRTVSPPPQASFHLVSGLQKGADRGALLGFDDARSATGASSQKNTTGGFTPLGYKCDDYIQASDIDPGANVNIEKEKKWLNEPVDPSVRALIDKFGIQELPNDDHKVKFKDKDKANANGADVLVGFRVDKDSTGAGTEQTINFGVFGIYTFVEQFRNGESAGGALMRAKLVSGGGWAADQVRQANDPKYPGAVVFRKGSEYNIVDEFVHTTPKDEEKSAQKGKEIFKMSTLTQADLQQQGWGTAAAAASAIVFTLTSDVDADALCADQLAGFLTECTPDDGTPLRVMITGATEAIFQGCQDRVRTIFKTTFESLL
jgi:hypothetical protein